MAIAVDSSKGNTYLASLFVDEMCARDELIRVVHHVWLTVNLMCACDKFAHVVHV